MMSLEKEDTPETIFSAVKIFYGYFSQDPSDTMAALHKIFGIQTYV
jgi:hypothetical protein